MDTWPDRLMESSAGRLWPPVAGARSLSCYSEIHISDDMVRARLGLLDDEVSLCCDGMGTPV